MLPDFPEVKGMVGRVINHAIREIVDATGPAALVQQMRHFEGKGWIRPGDASVTREYQKLAMPYELSMEELIARGPNAILERIPQLAQGMAAQLLDLMQQRMKEAEAEGSPYVVSFEGELSCDQLLALWERMEIGFDADGKAELPASLASRHAMERMRELQSDPDCSAKLQALLRRKKDEHDARESSRALVD